MASLVWSQRAKTDLRAIGRFYTQSSARQAELITRQIAGAVARLASFSLAGRLVTEADGDGLRVVFYRQYRIFYLYPPDGNEVDILSIWHSSRQIGGSPD